MAAEYEFYQFSAPQSHDGPERNSSATATFLRQNPVNSLPPLTEGMFGYSITRPVHNQDYYYGIFDTCAQFNCGIEGWHTESGPGVFEAVRWPLRVARYYKILTDVRRLSSSAKSLPWQTRHPSSSSS